MTLQIYDDTTKTVMRLQIYDDTTQNCNDTMQMYYDPTQTLMTVYEFMLTS